MYSILDKTDSDPKNLDDIEPLYGPAILKKNRRFRDAVSWGCVLLILLSFVAGLVVVSILLFNNGKGPGLQSADLPSTTNVESAAKEKKPVTETAKILKTSCGYVKGSQQHGIFVFKGIPYAIPPVGEYRWKPPVSREAVPAECQAEAVGGAFGSKCFQWDSTGNHTTGSEDCLYLNVWTPDPTTDADLDVMVFIHGGGTQTEIGQLYGAGLLTGSGHEPGMMPTPELVKSANMVFVTLNYRLGPFGFLALDVKDPETKQPIRGNFGLMDQRLALEWVQNNSRVFGGNPDKVTVFGVGAGASSILIHLASTGKPLFNRAWVASPPPHFNTTLRTAFRQNQEFVQNSECQSVPSESELHSCIYGLSPEAVMEAYPHHKWENRQFRDLPSENELDHIRGLIIVDGEFLLKMPYEIWSSYGDHHNIPLLLGTTAQETDDWPLPAPLRSWSWTDYEQYIFEQLGAFRGDLAANVQRLYARRIAPELPFTTLVTDIRVTCPVSAVAQLLSHFWREPVYRYVANFSLSRGATTPGDSDVIRYGSDVIAGGFRYAYHSIDVRHFFGTAWLGEEEEEDSSAESRAFTRRMRESVFEFARTGRIGGWSLYPHTILISSQLTPVRGYQEKQCNLWRENGMFPNYAWMN